jgi:O-antigen/teichoic acid export membrane protein
MTTKKNNVVNSSILMISASWLTKILGLMSTIILARLLTPNDFGLVAIVMLVIYFFNIFSETGCKQYLLSLQEVTDNELNTAWTLNIISKAIISGVIILTSPYSASFFSEPRLTNTLYFAALIPIINGLENPAIYLAKRNFNYQGIFKLNLISKIISFTITISLAYYLKSHWALIFGTLTHFSLMTIGSYFIVPFQPSFSLQNIKKQWDYSKWIFFRGLVGYTRAKVDTIILAKSYLTAELGVFNVAKEFAMLLYEQVACPLGEIIMTSVQKTNGNIEQTRLIVEKYFTVLFSILLPAVIGLSYLSDILIVIILGEQWRLSGELLSILAFLGFSSGLVIVFTATLSAMKKTKLIFNIDIITTTLILTTLILSMNTELILFSSIRTAVGYVILFAYLLTIKLILNVSLIRLFIDTIPSITASMLMLTSLFFISIILKDESLLNLVVFVLIGVFTYTFCFIIILKLPYKKPEAHLLMLRVVHSVISRFTLLIK